MADKMAKTYRVDISFVDGETPSAAKLNAWSKQISNALTTIEKAIGDIWDQSYPYFSTSDRLTQAFKAADGTELGDEKALEIVNLARLIGPSSALNPIHLSGLTSSERQCFETLGSNKTYWTLRYAPVVSTSLSFDESPASSFINKVALDTSLKDAGDYYLNNETGELWCITPTTSDVEITYTVDAEYDAYASYRGATFNVIPSPDQSVKCTATGPTPDGLYLITLPTLTDQDTDDTRTTTTLSKHQLNYQAQLILPTVLTHLSSGEVIPDGYLFIRDEDTGEALRGATYYYNNQYSLYIGGVTISTSHSFTVLTIGSNITQSIQDLQLKLWQLRRGRDSNNAISISSIAGRSGTYNRNETDAEPYGPSNAPSNFFPQYLHRDGWLENYDDTNINDQNGMRGDLVLLGRSRISGSKHHLDGDSRKLYFGKFSQGANIFFDYQYQPTGMVSGRRTLKLDGGAPSIAAEIVATDIPFFTELRIVAKEGATLGTTLGSTNESISGPFKWAYEELTFANVASQTISLSLALAALLTGKSIISINGIARVSGGAQWISLGMPTNGAGTDWGFGLFLDVSNPVDIDIFLESPAAWSVGLNNTLRLFIHYKD